MYLVVLRPNESCHSCRKSRVKPAKTSSFLCSPYNVSSLSISPEDSWGASRLHWDGREETQSPARDLPEWRKNSGRPRQLETMVLTMDRRELHRKSSVDANRESHLSLQWGTTHYSSVRDSSAHICHDGKVS